MLLLSGGLALRLVGLSLIARLLSVLRALFRLGLGLGLLLIVLLLSSGLALLPLQALLLLSLGALARGVPLGLILLLLRLPLNGRLPGLYLLRSDFGRGGPLFLLALLTTLYQSVPAPPLP